jgi:hypothetical protein
MFTYVLTLIVPPLVGALGGVLIFGILYRQQLAKRRRSQRLESIRQAAASA